MKQLKFFALIIAMLASVSFIASCGSDDDDNVDVTENSSIVGTWKMTHSWGYETMTFKKDGTGVLVEVDNYYSNDTDVEEFKWSVRGKILTIAYWEEPYQDSYSSSPGGWEYERYEIVSVDAKSMVLKCLPEDDDSYYFSEGEYEVWTRQ